MPVTIISLVTGSAAWKTDACVIVIIKSWVKRMNIEFTITWGADTLIAFSSGRICRGRSARSCEVKIDVFIFKHSNPSIPMSEEKDSLLEFQQFKNLYNQQIQIHEMFENAKTHHHDVEWAALVCRMCSHIGQGFHRLSRTAWNDFVTTISQRQILNHVMFSSLFQNTQTWCQVHPYKGWNCQREGCGLGKVHILWKSKTPIYWLEDWLEYC